MKAVGQEPSARIQQTLQGRSSWQAPAEELARTPGQPATLFAQSRAACQLGQSPARKSTRWIGKAWDC